MPAILSSLSLDLMTPKEQEETLLTLSDLVFRGTLVKMIQKMDDKTKDEFSDLLAKNASPEAVDAFLKTRVPGGEAAAGEVLAEITSDLAVVGV